MTGWYSLFKHLCRPVLRCAAHVADPRPCRCSSSQLQQYLQFSSRSEAWRSSTTSNHGLQPLSSPTSSCVTSSSTPYALTAGTGSSRCVSSTRSIRSSSTSTSHTSSSQPGAAGPSSTSSSSSSSSSADPSSPSPSRPAAAGSTASLKPNSSLDAKEAAKFAALADSWWDSTSGPFAPLHALNPARCSFVRQGVCSLRGLPLNHSEPLQGLRVLDVGCGGGLLSEPLARMGAEVHGIDVSSEGVAAAAAHAAGDPLLVERTRYQKITLEELVSRGASYDVVMASEVIEHVRRPQQFMLNLAAATHPGGQVFITTLNRTPASYAMGIVLAEYVLNMVPRGTHSWDKFITPQELAMMAADAGLWVEFMAGMELDAASGRFNLGQDMGVNYAALFSKPQQVVDSQD